MELERWFSNLATHWNLQGAKQNYWWLNTLSDFNSVSMGGSICVATFVFSLLRPFLHLFQAYSQLLAEVFCESCFEILVR